MNTADPKLIALLERIADALDRAYPKPEPETDLTRLRRAFPAWRWTQTFDGVITGTSEEHLFHIKIGYSEDSQWRARLIHGADMRRVTCDCETPLAAARILMEAIR
jgi:hypothetical protein